MGFPKNSAELWQFVAIRAAIFKRRYAGGMAYRFLADAETRLPCLPRLLYPNPIPTRPGPSYGPVAPVAGESHGGLPAGGHRRGLSLGLEPLPGSPAVEVSDLAGLTGLAPAPPSRSSGWARSSRPCAGIPATTGSSITGTRKSSTSSSTSRMPTRPLCAANAGIPVSRPDIGGRTVSPFRPT